MTGIYAKRAVLILVLLIVVVEGYFAYRWYAQYHGSGGTGPDTASGGAASLEGTMPGGTSLENTTTEGAGPSDAAGTTFAHTATEGNSRGDYTYLDHPAINGSADAVVVVEPSPEGASSSDGAYGHNIGVWFEPEARRWAVFNQDITPVPAGTIFEVVIPPESDGFVHRAGPANTVGNATYVDDPLLNGEPGATVAFTQNWNPGGGGGTYNDHPVDVFYDEDVQRWALYNRDGAKVPAGAAFNVAVPNDGGPAE